MNNQQRSYSQTNLSGTGGGGSHGAQATGFLGGSRNPLTFSGSQIGGSRMGLAAVGTSMDSVELQKLLGEERLRSDQHRTNYQLLKAEHSKLQDAYTRLESELTNETNDHRNAVERVRRELQETQRQLAEHMEENQRLRSCQITEERLERLRMEVSEELDVTYKERYSRLQSEAAACRAEVNRLRYENTFLKSEYEHLQMENARVLEEMKLMHEAEVANVRAERDQLLSRANVADDADKLKSLHKENTHLHVQIRTLKGELQEANASKATAINDMDLTVRNQAKEVATLRSSQRQLEAERDHLKQQLDESTKDINELRAECQRCNEKIHQLNREATQYKHQIEEACHKGRIDVNQLKLEASKQRGEIERQRDVLAAKVEEMEYQLQLAVAKAAQLERAMEDQEKNLNQRENSFREEERQKQKRLEEQKVQLEEQLAETQKKLSNQEPMLQSRLERLQDNLQQAEHAKQKAETEHEQLQKRYEKLSNKCTQLQRSVTDGQEKVTRQEQELEDCYSQLQSAKEERKEKLRLADQLNATQMAMRDQEERARKLMDESESQWKAHDREVTRRMKELEEELHSAQSQLCAIQEEQKKKKKRYATYFVKQKQHVQLLEARVAELSTENELLRKNVPHEEHAKLKKELKEMCRRHKEFKSIISGATNGRGPSGDHHMTSEEEFRLLEEVKRLKASQDESEVRQKEVFERLQEVLSRQQALQKKSVDDCDVNTHF